MSANPSPSPATANTPNGLSDEEIVARVLGGDIAAFELLMRRHNLRIYRTCRAVLRNETEAEDVMQDAYVRAYQHLRDFEGRSQFVTWLTRIAVHESLARRRRASRIEEFDSMTPQHQAAIEPRNAVTPEDLTHNNELRALLDRAILQLPDGYREVFVMCEVEEMSIRDTAHCLELTESNVKVRNHRAKAMLRETLDQACNSAAREAWSFHLSRCNSVVSGVMARITAERA